MAFYFHILSTMHGQNHIKPIFINFFIWVFFEPQTIKSKFNWNLTRITATLYEDQYTFFITSRSVLLRMWKVSDKSCRENQNTHFVFSKFFFFENRAVYEEMWKNIVERGRPQMTVSSMRIACLIPKATRNTLRICYRPTCCLFTATMFAWTHLSVTLYLHCLSYF